MIRRWCVVEQTARGMARVIARYYRRAAAEHDAAARNDRQGFPNPNPALGRSYYHAGRIA